MSPFQWFDDPNLSLAISYICYMNALHLLASNGQPPAISEWIDQWENKRSPAANL